MNFGNSTIIFRHFTKSGTPDALGHYTMVPSNVSAPNCRHRPLAFDEIVTLELDIGTEYWRSTIPIHLYSGSLLTAVLAVKPNDAIVVDGQDYQVIGGIRPHKNRAGVLFKATLISKKQLG